VRELRAEAFKTVHYNIDELYENLWIDRSTRAVFFELTVFNPHLLIFCSIKYVLFIRQVRCSQKVVYLRYLV